MTSPAVMEPSSTVPELRQGEAPADVWSPPWTPLDTSAEPPADPKQAYGSSHQTFVLSDLLSINNSLIFTVATSGLTISWPGHERTYDDDIRSQVSVLWAEDWDSDEDAVYDNW